MHVKLHKFYNLKYTRNWLLRESWKQIRSLQTYTLFCCFNWKKLKFYWSVLRMCTSMVYYFMEVVKISCKLRLIYNIMNAHTGYFSSRSQAWNFYICIFLTLTWYSKANLPFFTEHARTMQFIAFKPVTRRRMISLERRYFIDHYVCRYIQGDKRNHKFDHI